MIADTIYLVGSRQNGQIFDILIGKLDINGEAGGQCSFVQTLDVTVSDYVTPLDFTHDLEELGITHNYATAPLPVQTAENGVETEVICQKICSGCDTVVTYTLQFYQNSIVQVQCPANITVEAVSGANSAVVNYDLPVSDTDCPCGDATLELLQGPASGGSFPMGMTQVCFGASDDCGGTNSCCFTVAVQAAPPEEACDVKNTPCVKFEILGIFQNPAGQKTYRMRVTNFCPNKLIYTTFQLPDGLAADHPATNTTYTTPGGRQYEVRNPNASPAHSIRFKSIGNGIAGGQSDVFEYTLPQQADPLYIHATVRLDPQVYVETHLNVFNCEVQQTSSRPAADRKNTPGAGREAFEIYPNPASDVLFVQISAWANQRVQIRVRDALGRLLCNQTLIAETGLVALDLPADWPTGIYYLEAVDEQGERRTGRFVRTR